MMMIHPVAWFCAGAIFGLMAALGIFQSFFK